MNTNHDTRITTNALAAGEEAPLDPNAIVMQLRTLRQHIPGYGQLAIPKAAAIRRVAHVDADFVQSAINAVGASEHMQSAVGRTAEDLRREVDDSGSWSAVEDEVRALLKGVISANLVRRHRAGLAALQTYNIARQLVREPQHADLLPHVAEMRRLNKFGRHRGRGKQPPSTPAPSTPQPPSTTSPPAPTPHT